MNRAVEVAARALARKAAEWEIPIACSQTSPEAIAWISARVDERWPDHAPHAGLVVRALRDAGLMPERDAVGLCAGGSLPDTSNDRPDEATSPQAVAISPEAHAHFEKEMKAGLNDGPPISWIQVRNMWKS